MHYLLSNFACFIISLFVYIPYLFTLTLPIREVAKISSLKENQVSGYGIVVGLARTGDSRTTIATKTILKMLKSKGIKLGDAKFKSKNIAAVLVTAKLPAFSRIGDQIPIWISSIGDAKSLKGGYLLQTPLSAANGEVYAVAQSSINIKQGSNNTFRNKNVETTSYVTNGAIIEKEVIQPLIFNSDEQKKSFKLSLYHFNIQNIHSIVQSINKVESNSTSLHPDGSIQINIPTDTTPESFINKVLNLPVEIEVLPKVVIDPRTGTIIIGKNVGLSSVAISTSSMSIQVKSKISNPINTQNNNAKKKSVVYLEESSTVSDLVDILNKLQVSNQEIIDILNAIYTAGALHGELVIL